ncbi:DUF2971 domain-containing protein [Paraburkholderia sp. BL6665CI2N2]|uniref:DUF2971 domain-containing protein n=1 Tax=Paraburkholderia sp. BL6665CI2N2 TaxID=1938806 RepID=UPI001416F800|nr:DUF2971 domain-containing protein [Paraburkholderia sp. BL6665CI2N2]
MQEINGYVWCSYPEGLNDPFDGVSAAPYPQQLGIPVRSGRGIEGFVSFVFKWAVCCFSEKVDNPVMWAHYANNYSGVCAFYDKEAIGFKINEHNNRENRREIHEGTLPQRIVKLDKVNYFEKMPDLFTSVEEAIYSKMAEWSYEHEWRLAINGILQTAGEMMEPWNKNSKNGVTFNLEECIKRIDIGHRVKGHDRQRIVETVMQSNSNIEIFLIHPSGNGFKKVAL